MNKIKILILSVTLLTYGQNLKAQEDNKSLTIEFNTGKIIEIAYATIEGGKETQLGKKYFPKILPIAAKYGGKMLGSFQVTAITGGKLKPQMIAIFEWSSTDARERLLADKEAQKLFPIRDDAVTSINLSYYTVEEDVAVTFRTDKSYEFFNAWLTPEAETALPKYSELSKTPKLRYGPPKMLVALKPYGVYLADESYALHPNTAGIVEWNNVAAFYGLMADPEFIKVSTLLFNSVKRLDMVHGKINIPH